jgi:hypothetical protein
MENSVKIQYGKLGFFLVINGKAIKRTWKGEIIATKVDPLCANNWNATEWQSLKHLRLFWNDYRLIILDKAK